MEPPDPDRPVRRNPLDQDLIRKILETLDLQLKNLTGLNLNLIIINREVLVQNLENPDLLLKKVQLLDLVLIISLNPSLDLEKKSILEVELEVKVLKNPKRENLAGPDLPLSTMKVDTNLFIN